MATSIPQGSLRISYPILEAPPGAWTYLTAPNGAKVPVGYTNGWPHIGIGIGSLEYFMGDTRDIVSSIDKPLCICEQDCASKEQMLLWPARALPGINYASSGFHKIVIPPDVKCCGARHIWIHPNNAQDIETINKYVELSLPAHLKSQNERSAWLAQNRVHL